MIPSVAVGATTGLLLCSLLQTVSANTLLELSLLHL